MWLNKNYRNILINLFPMLISANCMRIFIDYKSGIWNKKKKSKKCLKSQRLKKFKSYSSFSYFSKLFFLTVAQKLQIHFQ